MQYLVNYNVVYLFATDGSRLEILSPGLLWKWNGLIFCWEGSFPKNLESSINEAR